MERLVSTICCYQGYYTHTRFEYGAKGVGLSTTSAAVLSCVLILKPGGTIIETESSLDVEEIISKYAFGDV